MWDNSAMGGANFLRRLVWAGPNPCSVATAAWLGRQRVSTVLLVGVLCAAGHPVHATPPTGSAAAPERQIVFYPTAGQSGDQQARDRYECFLAAAGQARFDPSQPQLPAAYRIPIVASPTPPPNTTAQSDDTTPAPTAGADLGQRAAHYRQLVRHCLVRRGYGVR